MQSNDLSAAGAMYRRCETKDNTQSCLVYDMSLTSINWASGKLLGALEASRLGKAMDGAGLLVPESCYQSSLESA